MIQIKIISFALSMMFNSASSVDIPHNRLISFNIKTPHLEVSRMWQRSDGRNSNGEDIEINYKTWKKTNITLEHFRNSGADINLQTIRTRYWIVGSEIIYKDWFQGNPKYLNWFGSKIKIKRMVVGLSYSSNFEAGPKRFSKKEMEFEYYQKLKGNFYLKPIYKRKSITDGLTNKSDWKLSVFLEWKRR